MLKVDIRITSQKHYIREEEPELPEVSELQIVRHYTAFQKNHGIDSGFYPLGSCTMKYNPKINEDIARLQVCRIHPYQPEETVQGALEMLYTITRRLSGHHRHG